MITEQVQIGVLGQLAVSRGEEDVEIGSGKQRLLLALLASRPTYPMAPDRLVETLWPERPPASARANVQTYMHRLRGTLGSEVIVRRAGGYQLNGAAIASDAAAFEEEVTAARRLRDEGDTEDAATTYRRALARWRGEAFDGMTDAGPLTVEAARLEELRVVARQECVDCELALGRHRALIPELMAAVADHPLDEHLLAQTMTALHRAGRSTDALEVYRRAHRLMADELGLAPGPALREVQQAILTQTL